MVFADASPDSLNGSIQTRTHYQRVVLILLIKQIFLIVNFRRRPQNAENEQNRENADRPGIFRMLFIFVTRFITSLVPAQNPPVNIN